MSRSIGSLAVWLLVAAAAGAALAQTTARPVAVERPLTPSARDRALLDAQSKDPLAERAKTVLRQTRGQNGEQADLLTRAATSTTPVLAPADPALLQTARLRVADDHYVLTLTAPGQNIEIHGASQAFAAPSGDGATAASAPRLERTEYGVDLTFQRYGAVYLVTFECEQMAVGACSDTAIQQFAANLKVIGGGQ